MLSISMNSLLLLQFGIFLACPVCGIAGEKFTLQLQAEDFDREECVISCPLPQGYQKDAHLQLISVETQQSVPVQIDSDVQPLQLVWILESPLPAGEIRQYEIGSASESDPPRNRIEVTDQGNLVEVTALGKTILNYRTEIVQAKNRNESYYDKSGYFHPIYTPAGTIVTDDFNPDHAHQHGVMYVWRKILFQGRSTNGWDQKSQTGEVVHRDVSGFVSGPVFGGFTATLAHNDLTAPDGKLTMLDETWKVRIFTLKDRYLIDIRSLQECAMESPVTIAKIHYGGMTLRGRAEWAKKRNYDYLTSEGLNKENGNQSRPEWVEMSGPVDGGFAGVTLFCDPQNYRYPQPVRLHPTMPYLCFAVASLGDFVIEPSTPYHSHYLLSVHDGKINEEANQRIMKGLAHPPQVKVIKNSE